MKEFRGKHGKVTDIMAQEMKKLREEGKTFREIAVIYNVALSTIQYHVSPGEKEKNKKLVYERRKKLGPTSKQYPERRREYMRNYMKDRYNNDPEFRERMIKHVANSQKRRVHSLTNKEDK